MANSRDGVLRYVASLHSGFSSRSRGQLQALLDSRRRSQPVVSCPYPVVGVEPDLYCLVRFLDWTRHGHLRGASFQRLLGSDGAQAGPLPVSLR